MPIVVRDKWGDPILNASFNEHVDVLLSHKAESKGYDGEKGQLFSLCHQLPHPLGEIIYKVVRYHKQGDPDDLLKIAGWARILWERKKGEGDVDGKGSSGGDLSVEEFARTSVTGHAKRGPDTREGDAGGAAGGARHIKPAKTFSPADIIAHGFKVGTGSSGRGRGAVGSKHRQRKGARKGL